MSGLGMFVLLFCCSVLYEEGSEALDCVSLIIKRLHRTQCVALLVCNNIILSEQAE